MYIWNIYSVSLSYPQKLKWMTGTTSWLRKRNCLIWNRDTDWQHVVVALVADPMLPTYHESNSNVRLGVQKNGIKVVRTQSFSCYVSLLISAHQGFDQASLTLVDTSPSGKPVAKWWSSSVKKLLMFHVLQGKNQRNAADFFPIRPTWKVATFGRKPMETHGVETHSLEETCVYPGTPPTPRWLWKQSSSQKQI